MQAHSQNTLKTKPKKRSTRPMSLTNLGPQKGSKRKSRRKGRGISAGQGASGGFGMRGQKSRSGRPTRPGFEGGQTPLYRRLPKLKYFHVVDPKQFTIVNLDQLQDLPAGTEVTLESLMDRGIITQNDGPLKVLGRGEVTVPLHVTAAAFSAPAQEKLEAVGGTCLLDESGGMNPSKNLVQSGVGQSTNIIVMSLGGDNLSVMHSAVNYIDMAPPTSFNRVPSTVAELGFVGKSDKLRHLEEPGRNPHLTEKEPMKGRDSLKSKFDQLARKWRVETAFWSSITKILNHPAYQEIISLGKPVLPLIFAELEKEPDYWFLALREITGENPVPKEVVGKIDKMAELWLEFARKEGILPLANL